MIRRSALIWLLLTGLTGFGLYQIKYEVQAQEEQLARINKAVVENQEAIQVLSAEWSFLNRPDRLAEMARRYLEMSPVVPAQFTEIGKLPDRGAVVDASQLAVAAPAQKPVPVRATAKPATPLAGERPAIAAAKPVLRLPPQPTAASAPTHAHAPPRAQAAALPKPILSPPPLARPPASLHAAAYVPPAAESPPTRAGLSPSSGTLLANLIAALGEAPATTAPAPEFLTGKK